MKMKVLTFFIYLSTSQGTWERLLKPPKAVPFQTRPVTNWNGRVDISWPDAATPTMTEVPHPYEFIEKFSIPNSKCGIQDWSYKFSDKLPYGSTQEQTSLQRHSQCTQNYNRRHHLLDPQLPAVSVYHSLLGW